MIYLELLFGFLRVGCFSFGGAYGAIPLIRDVVRSYGWLTDEMLTYMIAVRESTPGPIMVNLATYVGSQQAGILGAIIATAADVLPSFIVILLITILLKALIKNRYVQAILSGIKPSIIGIILATGVYMTINNCIFISGAVSVNFRSLLITAILIAVIYVTKKRTKRNLSSIRLIALSALFGIIIYAV